MSSQKLKIILLKKLRLRHYLFQGTMIAILVGQKEIFIDFLVTTPMVNFPIQDRVEMGVLNSHWNYSFIG